MTNSPAPYRDVVTKLPLPVRSLSHLRARSTHAERDHCVCLITLSQIGVIGMETHIAREMAETRPSPVVISPKPAG